MNRKVIVSCAVTGSGDSVGKHPAIPVTPEEIAIAVVGEMINRRRNPGNTWNPNSKSIFADGIPQALQVQESEQPEAPEPTAEEPVATAAKLPPLRRS